MSDIDIDVKELARQVVDELEDTRQIGDQLLLSRREAIALSTGAVSLGALGVAGAGTASAQEAAGRVGTESEPVDVEGAQGNFSQGVSVDGPLEAEDLQADLDGDLIPVADPIGEYEQSSSTSSDVTVQFAGLSTDTMYLVRYSVHPSNAGLMQITFNGDDADSNANYGYYDETGTPQTSEDAIEAADYGSNPALDGVFSFRKQASNFRVGLNNRPMPGSTGQLNGYADAGGWDNENESGLDSVTVTFVGGLRAGDSVQILEALQ